MTIGCWTNSDDIPRVVEAGFEYVELAVPVLVPEEDDSAFDPVRRRLQECPLPIVAFNQFIPRAIPIVGPDVDWERLTGYAATAIRRIGELGVRRLVFGSGPARTVPEGFPRREAEEQIVRFARAAGDCAAQAGVVIGIESITRRGGTNIMNTLAEAVEMARRIDHPAVKVIADLGQMAFEGDPWQHLLEYKDWIAHAHLFDTGLLPPGLGTIDWDTALGFLRSSGYDGPMTFECKWSDFEHQAAKSIAFVRSRWDRAGVGAR